ncbi:MAG: hypothetical protein UW07_C0039G0019 [Candidatus Nomurabacteria bacterium GW2011_GWF2_43_8]|uniref:DUF2726 domain-containing protein n=3 Tax=Candidatus Nomuraibacteriota TaxID=1752729 RepID=A0A0G1FIX0_9BACT|nr:MAG: hypothetical protein UV76_C0001G0013 [Candidatus Nomurabacteria bacterium GW2011_GWA2_43_15]KKT19277.1 MAG: hypothetical protein UW02_C0012G0008 [Candidatus Nomurabacteria bacterium GW2011_GWB1_43_7]KKT22311.1 MAG: hypothetical protein UW07_C0039G0019 [Candidatus Nomurabacteria bacterium GW2011_GWF2_43_8]
MPPGFIFLLIVVVLAVVVVSFLKGEKKDLSVYKRKNFLFDTVNEFNLYKILLELFGDQYYIFPQVNYSHLVEVKPMSFTEQRKYRSSIDRKSADFVLCDKGRIVPRLVIELDGRVHNLKNKQTRDKFIDDLTKIVDLPILHLKTTDFDREFIKNEINQKLNSN